MRLNMAGRIANVAMLLPGRRTGYGSIEWKDGAISSIVAEPLATGFNAELLVIPGLVNAHGHSPMTLVRGLGSGLPLQRWLSEAIFPVEARMTADDIYVGAKWAAMEMLASGTVAVADMYEFPDAVERALKDVGVRVKSCRVGLAFANGEPRGRLAECIAFAEQDAEHDLCIHSEYLTDENFCRALAEANRELARRVHFHASETEKEHDECVARHGKTPIRYLNDLGLLDAGGYAAHCVYCTDDDFRIMAEKNVALVHNPTSNLKLGSGIARVARAMELGVTVALGTDGCASNDNLDMFEEMHLASLLHKGVGRDPSLLSPWQIIEMATANGAKAIGIGNSGELAVGRRADFCVIDLKRLHLTPALDLANLVVHSMHGSDVVETYVGGERLYDRGSFARADIEETRRALLASVGRIM